MTDSGHVRGVTSMIGAVALFALMDSGLKLLSPHYPPMQVAALRGLASLPLVFIWALVDGGIGQLIRVRWPLHLLRGVLAVVMLAAFAYALRQMPLAEAYAIFFIAPLLITALAVPLLREHVGWRRWVAIVLGLIGVIVVLKPTGEGMITIGGLAALASAVGYAISAITIKVLSRTDTGSATIFWALFFIALISGILTAFDWTPLRWEHWYLIVGVGFFGAVGQHFITYAFRQASPAVVAPIEYTALMWGMLFDWLLWLTLPNARMLFGAAIIVASGLYIIYRERQLIAAPG